MTRSGSTSLNGDKYKTGKVAPDGSPDPSIFSTEGDPVGIQVGTAIATLVRKADHEPATSVEFRNLWGQKKPEQLIATSEAEPDALYSKIEPVLPLGLPFVETAVSADWFDWPALPELFPVSFPGVKTSRDGFLVDTDLDRLKARVGEYFDPTLSDREIARRYPRVMRSSGGFDARAVREGLLRRGDCDESGFVRFAYRPFDDRWLYWEKDGLLDRPRAEYQPHAFEGNVWLSAAQHLRKGADEPQAYRTDHLGSLHLIERGALMFPAWLREEGLGYDTRAGRRANLSSGAERFLARLGLGVEDLFHHVLATLHDPAYREANAGALRMEWPRIPLSGWPDGDTEGAAEELARSAAHGRKLAALLDPQTPVPGVTRPPLRPEIAAIAVPCTVGGRNMTGGGLWRHRRLGAFGRGRRRDAWPGPRRRTFLRAGGIRGRRRRGGCSRRQDLRCLPERGGLLAQRSGRHLGLQARWLPGAQEVVVLSGTEGPRSETADRGGSALRGHGAADWGAVGCPGWRGGEGGLVGRDGGPST